MEYQAKHAKPSESGESAGVDNPPADRLKRPDLDKPGTDRLEANRQANHAYAAENPAFAAFLELPDTDIDHEPSHLRLVFESNYMGSYGDKYELARALSPVGSVEDAVIVCESEGVDGSFVHIDYDHLVRLLESGWEFVWKDGRVYVFSK